MAPKKKKTTTGPAPHASNLSFKLRGGPPAAGCRYALVVWKPGSGSKRTLISCHRTITTARAARTQMKKALKRAPGMQGKAAKMLMGASKQCGVYNLVSGKKVK